MTTLQQTTNRKAIAWAIAAALSGASANALATTDLADVPLASSSTTAVKPNMMFMFDDSSSMLEMHMPDEMGSNSGRASYRNHYCNTIYYNPAVFYQAPPQLATGKRFTNASFTAAKDNGYDTSATATTTNLSTSFRAHTGGLLGGTADTAQPAYYYTITAGTPPASPLDAACSSAPNSSTAASHSASGGGLTWTKVLVSTTSGPGGTDERQNFANWYSFYRSRLMMMKGATGRAFVSLSSSYRVGFLTINPSVSSGVLTSKYLRIADFDATHKQSFLDKLYGQTAPSSSPFAFTPLREALSRAGWLYAGQLGSGLTKGILAADDPVQYSCQQNFTLLTTDGYWNSGNGLDLSGNPVGNQDADLTASATDGSPAKTVLLSPRPIYDSGFTSTVTDTTTTRTYFLSTSGCSSPRRRVRYNETVEQRVRAYAGTEVISDQTTTNTTSNINYTSCQNPAPALPSPNPSVTTTSTTGAGGGGSTNSLADVAQYYYRTDLRPAMPNDVPESGSGVEDDRAPWQHMTTFTMGLGIFGQLNFKSNYETDPDPTSDFNRIRSGALNWPVTPDNTDTFVPTDPAKADDLWHAAVNGRGAAFNASNPDSVVVGLNAALASLAVRKASAAAAATSNLEPVAGDNFAYTASYETVKWQGELQAREIDLGTGLVKETPIWSAQAKLNAKTRDACDTRVIHLFRAGATDNMVPFKWNTDTCGGTGLPLGTPLTTLNATEQAYFNDAAVSILSQWPTLTDGSGGTVNQRADAVGASMVNFLRGQRGKETFIPGAANRLYRSREFILGDIVNAQPVFVKKPFANYLDSGYDAFKSTHAGRTPMVYVAANDGMLHAFYAGTSVSDPDGGQEAWAFIPTMVLPKLPLLADNNYANLHQFTVDGTPVAGDVYDGVQWRTILVGGLNKGGKGYYALDITNPASPKAMWEFQYSPTCFDPSSSATWKADCNLGYTYGNPVITKLADGTWVVMVASGYNNQNGAPKDGEGFLYVLNAISGEIIKKIGTGTGDGTTPSGLGKINNWVNDGLSDNTTQRVYGVDLLGNVWRFDVNGAAATGSLAQLLATVRDGALPTGQPQPITSKPELATVGGKPFVYVATGSYLGTSDISTTQLQTIYAIHDPMSSTIPTNTVPVYADLRTPVSPGGLREITVTNTPIDGLAARTATCNTNCSGTDGWYADLPDSGERVNVDMKLQLGTLTILSNVPGGSACTIGGYSYINFFDYTNGMPIHTMVGLKLADSLAVGLNVVRLPSGKTVAIGTTSDSKQRTTDVPISSPGMLGRRVSWREIGE